MNILIKYYYCWWWGSEKGAAGDENVIVNTGRTSSFRYFGLFAFQTVEEARLAFD